jgi:hypothetical protein
VWIDRAQESGVRVAELTRRTAVEAGAIQRDALADPLDRLLVATARPGGHFRHRRSSDPELRCGVLRVSFIRCEAVVVLPRPQRPPYVITR